MAAGDRCDAAVVRYLRARGAEGAELAGRVAELLGVPATDAGAGSTEPPLLEVYEAGLAALGVEAPAAEADNDYSDVEGTSGFARFLDKVKAAGVMKDVEEGTPAYAALYDKIVQRYRAHKAKKQAKENNKSVATEADREARIKRADELKAEGNTHISAGRFNDAAAKYTAAIEQCADGPSSHIYFSNRAAARMKMSEYESAAEDARESIKLKPSYLKAHNRLCTSLFQTKDFEACLVACEEALEVDPENDTVRNIMAKARTSLAQGNSVTTPAASAPGATPAAAPGADPMAAMAGLFSDPSTAAAMSSVRDSMAGGGTPDIAGLMSNPAIQGLMSNPAFMQSAMSMMQNPAFSSMLGSMTGGDPSNLAAMAQQMAGGMGGMPGAAPDNSATPPPPPEQE